MSLQLPVQCPYYVLTMSSLCASYIPAVYMTIRAGALRAARVFGRQVARDLYLQRPRRARAQVDPDREADRPHSHGYACAAWRPLAPPATSPASTLLPHLRSSQIAARAPLTALSLCTYSHKYGLYVFSHLSHSLSCTSLGATAGQHSHTARSPARVCVHAGCVLPRVRSYIQLRQFHATPR